MKVLNVEQQDDIRDIAERLIGNYIQAVEFDDLSDPNSWIWSVDHWHFDCKDGEYLLKILGKSPEEIERSIQGKREELEELRDYYEENE